VVLRERRKQENPQGLKGYVDILFIAYFATNVKYLSQTIGIPTGELRSPNLFHHYIEVSSVRENIVMKYNLLS